MTLPAVSKEPEKIKELKDASLWLWCGAAKYQGWGGESCYIVVGCTEMGTNVCFSYLKYEENKKGKPDVCIESLKYLIL